MAKGFRGGSPMGGGNMANMMKQAQRMQQQMLQIVAVHKIFCQLPLIWILYGPTLAGKHNCVILKNVMGKKALVRACAFLAFVPRRSHIGTAADAVFLLKIAAVFPIRHRHGF